MNPHLSASRAWGLKGPVELPQLGVCTPPLKSGGSWSWGLAGRRPAAHLLACESWEWSPHCRHPDPYPYSLSCEPREWSPHCRLPYLDLVNGLLIFLLPGFEQGFSIFNHLLQTVLLLLLEKEKRGAASQGGTRAGHSVGQGGKRESLVRGKEEKDAEGNREEPREDESHTGDIA